MHSLDIFLADCTAIYGKVHKEIACLSQLHANFCKQTKLRISTFSQPIRIISILSICPHEVWSFCKDTREWCHCSSMCSTGRSFRTGFIIKRLMRPSTRTYVRKHECPFATVKKRREERRREREGKGELRICARTQVYSNLARGLNDV